MAARLLGRLPHPTVDPGFYQDPGSRHDRDPEEECPEGIDARSTRQSF
jgi:hypothetical protein